MPHRLRVSGRAGYCWPLLRGPASASSVRAAAQRARAGLAPGAQLAAAEPPLLHALSAGVLWLHKPCARARACWRRDGPTVTAQQKGRLQDRALRAVQKGGPPARRLAVAELLLPRDFGLVFRALHAFGGGAPARTYAGVARGLAARGAAAALRELLANVSGTLGDDEWDQVRRRLRALERVLGARASPPAVHGGVLCAARRQAARQQIACAAELLAERPARAARAARQGAACCDPSELPQKPDGLKRARRSTGARFVRGRAVLPCIPLAFCLAPQARARALPSVRLLAGRYWRRRWQAMQRRGRRTRRRAPAGAQTRTGLAAARRPGPPCSSWAPCAQAASRCRSCAGPECHAAGSGQSSTVWHRRYGGQGPHVPWLGLPGQHA